MRKIHWAAHLGQSHLHQPDRSRNLAENTQSAYLQQIAAYARYFNRSPDLLGPEAVRTYQLYLMEVRALTPSSICVAMGALRFLYKVTGLLRALIIELESVEQRAESMVYINNLHDLVNEQLRRLPVQNFHLPWPQSPRLQRVCETLYANPADNRGVVDWSRELGTSSRTLARHFAKEVGITLREWRYRLRLFLALEWLCAGRNMTAIALDLGYASTSAFTFMFRQEMGCPPSEWRTR